ncbi:hypothetical protein HCG48_14775 [Oxynema aestuarii AP17]|uniref:Uncharacterized protein n=1 Tax=Oxynema aestuarii AP17 TaxID=2064643 RepID=A0A6H1TYJ7_9CYAN|nr:hypothetical protein HCG48_14775 [Oxynema aestuarii AP17]
MPLIWGQFAQPNSAKRAKRDRAACIPPNGDSTVNCDRFPVSKTTGKR